MKTKLLFFALFLSSLCFSQLDEKFYQPGKTMKPIENLKFQEFSIPAEKDTITGIFIESNVVPKATVLFFHGSGGNVSSYTFMVKPLVDAGYQVMMIDFRGYGKSSGTPTHQNIQSDGQKFLEYALSLPQTTGKPVIIYGASMGSQIATHLAKNNPTVIEALILDGAMSSHADIASHFSPENAAMIQSIPFPYSAKEDVKTLTMPKLFIHSAADKMIPIAQAQIIFDNAPEPKKFLTYEGDHLEGMVKNGSEIIKNIEALMKKQKKL